MFKKLIINDFESHEYTILKFHKGVNSIVGESDSGKSSIIKNLKLHLTNKLKGNGFISDWADTTESELTLDNNIKTTRIKGKEGNLYKTSLSNTPFKSFGTDVPEEIENIFNINEINIQTQSDIHFLLNNTPGEVAKYLNKIVDLSIIDRSHTNIEKKIRKEKSDLKYTEEQFENKKLEFKKYNWLKDANEDIKELSLIENEIEDLENDIEIIEDNCIIVRECSSKIQEFEKVIKLEKKVNELIKLNGEIKKDENEISILEDILDDISNYKNKIKECKNNEKELQKEFNELMPDICPLCNK